MYKSKKNGFKSTLLLSTAVQSSMPFNLVISEGASLASRTETTAKTGMCCPKSGENWFHHAGTEGQGPVSNYW